MKKYALEALLCVLLVSAVAGVYSQVIGFDFVDLDDPRYITDNHEIMAGLTLNGVKWAFTSFYAANWHPLTWISHMADIELFGMDPGMHHLTNLVLHAVNTVLLFVLLRFCTGGVWKSAAVAALFALHPLHVESTAWISERKDVLSTLFWMLTLLGYAWYVKRPSVRRYLLTALSLALGLMAKPMLVTLPFVLLLMDYWPLKRFGPAAPTPAVPPAIAAKTSHAGEYRGRSQEAGEHRISLPGMGHPVLEKVPLFAMAAASCVVTFMAQKSGGAVSTLEMLPLSIRISNSLVSYVAYLRNTMLPVDLAVFYPLDRTIEPMAAAGAFLFILAVTAAVLLRIRKAPYLAFGWLWYTGTLLPVIGLVQVGAQAMADRYTYVPLIGIFIMIVWGLEHLSAGRRAGKTFLAGSFCAAAAALAVLTWLQAGTWKDSVSLFSHAIGNTKENYLAHNNLGCALYKKNDLDGAIRQYTEALKISPHYGTAHSNLALALDGKGEHRKALAHYYRALKLNPKSARCHYAIGKGLAASGNTRIAAREYMKALKIDPYHIRALNDLGALLISQGRADEGKLYCMRALRLNPRYTAARLNLIIALQRQGRIEDALFQIGIALRHDPKNRRPVPAGTGSGGKARYEAPPAGSGRGKNQALYPMPDRNRNGTKGLSLS